MASGLLKLKLVLIYLEGIYLDFTTWARLVARTRKTTDDNKYTNAADGKDAADPWDSRYTHGAGCSYLPPHTLDLNADIFTRLGTRRAPLSYSRTAGPSSFYLFYFVCEPERRICSAWRRTACAYGVTELAMAARRHSPSPANLHHTAMRDHFFPGVDVFERGCIWTAAASYTWGNAAPHVKTGGTLASGAGKMRWMNGTAGNNVDACENLWGCAIEYFQLPLGTLIGTPAVNMFLSHRTFRGLGVLAA
ncbi:hypothetical protein B0H16DRAFT_1449945 [Mycena metata]|uniref:Uncharacterized protein n=1 Tax=Mycena metata TaxID=1033252 RepID=A0AAD7K1T5_9AGAR|nr:hypothetical protein B0H16DRAFT_1449945 [Mycena metata]